MARADRRAEQALNPPVAAAASGALHSEYVQVQYDHPTYFDHPTDHLPGLLLIEAALHGAGLTTAERWPQLHGFQLRFHRYAELHLPTLVVVNACDHSDDPAVTVCLTQINHVVASGRVLLANALSSR
jgi:hypothetical protein